MQLLRRFYLAFVLGRGVVTPRGFFFNLEGRNWRRRDWSVGFLKRSIIGFLSWVDEDSSLTFFAYLLFCWHLEVNKNLNKNPFGFSYLWCSRGRTQPCTTTTAGSTEWNGFQQQWSSKWAHMYFTGLQEKGKGSSNSSSRRVGQSETTAAAAAAIEPAATATATTAAGTSAAKCFRLSEPYNRPCGDATPINRSLHRVTSHIWRWPVELDYLCFNKWTRKCFFDYVFHHGWRFEHSNSAAERRDRIASESPGSLFVCLFIPLPLVSFFYRAWCVYICTLPCPKRCAGLVSFIWNWCFLEADGKCWNPIQGEQVRQLLEEKRQRHSRALVAAIEEGIVRHFREKDLEIENIKRQNEELAEHVKQLRMEAHRWEVKAKTNEAMVAALKSNLQQAHQAVALSREQSKEGCGDSEADDAASSHHGDDPHARTFQENRELREQRMCRVCRCNDVSILLLPCRHLCLCKECETRLDTCPLCRSLKNASVQVYMSWPHDTRRRDQDGIFRYDEDSSKMYMYMQRLQQLL